jgi:hypothetical protein
VAARSSITGMRLNVHSQFTMPGQAAKIRSLDVYDWASKEDCV